MGTQQIFKPLYHKETIKDPNKRYKVSVYNEVYYLKQIHVDKLFSSKVKIEKVLKHLIDEKGNKISKSLMKKAAKDIKTSGSLYSVLSAGSIGVNQGMMAKTCDYSKAEEKTVVETVIKDNKNQ